MFLKKADVLSGDGNDSWKLSSYHRPYPTRVYEDGKQQATSVDLWHPSGPGPWSPPGYFCAIQTSSSSVSFWSCYSICSDTSSPAETRAVQNENALPRSTKADLGVNEGSHASLSEQAVPPALFTSKLTSRPEGVQFCLLSRLYTGTFPCRQAA